MPPSAITVCALPSSTLQTTPTAGAAEPSASMARAQAGAACADDQDIVLVSFVSCRSQESQVQAAAKVAPL